MKALKQAEFTPAEAEELLHLLAGLLHLSNATFIKGTDENLQLQDSASADALKRAASLLGFKVEELEEVLRFRHIALKSDILVKPRNEQQSASVCCSLIKFIYSRLFDYVVHRLNESAARHVRGKQHQNKQNDANALKSIGSKQFLLCSRHGKRLLQSVFYLIGIC